MYNIKTYIQYSFYKFLKFWDTVIFVQKKERRYWYPKKLKFFLIFSVFTYLIISYSDYIVNLKKQELINIQNNLGVFNLTEVEELKPFIDIPNYTFGFFLACIFYFILSLFFLNIAKQFQSNLAIWYNSTAFFHFFFFPFYWTLIFDYLCNGSYWWIFIYICSIFSYILVHLGMELNEEVTDAIDLAVARLKKQYPNKERSWYYETAHIIRYGQRKAAKFNVMQFAFSGTDDEGETPLQVQQRYLDHKIKFGNKQQALKEQIRRPVFASMNSKDQVLYTWRAVVSIAQTLYYYFDWYIKKLIIYLSVFWTIILFTYQYLRQYKFYNNLYPIGSYSYYDCFFNKHNKSLLKIQLNLLKKSEIYLPWIAKKNWNFKLKKLEKTRKISNTLFLENKKNYA